MSSSIESSHLCRVATCSNCHLAQAEESDPGGLADAGGWSDESDGQNAEDNSEDESEEADVAPAKKAQGKGSSSATSSSKKFNCKMCLRGEKDCLHDESSHHRETMLAGRGGVQCRNRLGDHTTH